MSNNLSSVVSLYVSTCRLAILASGSVESGEIAQNEIETDETNVNNNHNHTNQTHRNHFNTHWNELNRLMPCLRQALTCCHCSRIASDPITINKTNKESENDDCSRLENETGLKCRVCAKRNHLNDVTIVDNVQGKILIQCYRKLCQYLESTSFYRKLGTNGGTRGSLANLIGEGAAIEDDEDEVEECPTPLVGTSLLSRLLASPPMSETPIANGLSSRGPPQMSQLNDNSVQVYSVSMDCDYGTRITIKRKPRSSSSSSMSSSSSSNDSLPLAYTVSRSSAYYKQAKTLKTVATSAKPESGAKESETKVTKLTNALRVCRCGNATNQPGKLTCCGQRCPCYVDRRPCVRCKCRGCKNPRKSTTKDDEPQNTVTKYGSSPPSSSSCSSSSTVSLCNRSSRDVSEVVTTSTSSKRSQKPATKRKAIEHNNET